jgi:hemerythrin-like metal-binding protein
MSATQQLASPPQWDDALLLRVPPIDDDHKEIVALLASVVMAEDTELLPRWSALIITMQEHFEREDGWMQMTGFTPDNCHSSQHTIILRILREGETRGQLGELAVVRQMADELGQWLPQHVESMDASMVAHFSSVGFDVNTGGFTHDRPLAVHDIEGCGGGGSCAGDW